MQNEISNNKYYSDHLLEEYLNARGFGHVDVHNPVIIRDIEEFIIERKRSNEFYGELLDRLSLDCRECDTIENISAKEFLISHTCDYDTTVASSDKRIYEDVRADRILPGFVRVYDGFPVLVSKKDGVLVTKTLEEFHTIMVTNPRIGAMSYFANIIKTGKYNLIMGINGNRYDYDRKQKLIAMDRIANYYGNGIIKHYITDDSTQDYAYVIASRGLTRF